MSVHALIPSPADGETKAAEMVRKAMQEANIPVKVIEAAFRRSDPSVGDAQWRAGIKLTSSYEMLNALVLRNAALRLPW